jgi:gamma-glutamyltranspeptidase/glutathione hydrolase
MQLRVLTLVLFGLSAAAVICQPITANSGMAVSSEPIATDVGVKILKEGGNAFDAAVAMGFALAVTYPEAGNLGGGGFMVGLTQHGTPLALDFRETAPKAATRDMFLDESGNIIPGKSLTSYKAVGVPGTVDGLLEMQRKFGKLTLEQDMAPAIRLAKVGFAVSAALHSTLDAAKERLGKLGPTAAIFYPDGNAVPEGSTLTQMDLGKTLQRISDSGRQGFYEGEVAATMARTMEREGGLITQQDMKGYHAKWRGAFRFRSDDYEVITMPLPSSGGVTLEEILGLSDLKALQASGRNSAAYVQQLAEAERLGYADRNKYLGDSDFVSVPIDQLTSKSYLDVRRKLMPAGRAGSNETEGAGAIEKPETTHYCVVDKAGNVASVTYTLNGAFGMGVVLPGAGFLLNNEMDDFTSKQDSPNMFGLVQGEANDIQPGKRMLSSMSPTILLRDGRFVATFGTPGGSTIITTVLQVFLNMALFNMDIRAAIDAPRFHFQGLPDVIMHESDAFSPEVEGALTGMGYKLSRTPLGLVNGIAKMPDGSLRGWSDKRGSGKALGY